MFPKVGDATGKTIQLGNDELIPFSCEVYCPFKFRSLLNGTHLFAEDFFAAFIL